TPSKMRIFAAGSTANLATGIILIGLLIMLGDALPDPVYIFLQWVYFLSINIALVNMLPIHPLDGGRILKAFISTWHRGGKVIERVTMYSFIALMASNLILSLIRFGFIPL
ncbi:MAG: M50 family metallopeptidase, partial [Candidatus Bathyarchaeia archaeon]